MNPFYPLIRIGALRPFARRGSNRPSLRPQREIQCKYSNFINTKAGKRQKIIKRCYYFADFPQEIGPKPPKSSVHPLWEALGMFCFYVITLWLSLVVLHILTLGLWGQSMQAHPNFFTMTFSRFRSFTGMVMVTFSWSFPMTSVFSCSTPLSILTISGAPGFFRGWPPQTMHDSISKG